MNFLVSLVDSGVNGHIGWEHMHTTQIGLNGLQGWCHFAQFSTAAWLHCTVLLPIQGPWLIFLFLQWFQVFEDTFDQNTCTQLKLDSMVFSLKVVMLSKLPKLFILLLFRYYRNFLQSLRLFDWLSRRHLIGCRTDIRISDVEHVLNVHRSSRDKSISDAPPVQQY